MLKIGQTYFKNLAGFTLQDFKSMFDHFSTLYMKGLFCSVYCISFNFKVKIILLHINSFSSNHAKWSNTFKQFVGNSLTILWGWGSKG